VYEYTANVLARKDDLKFNPILVSVRTITL
jgi:hypothetical protein